MLLGFTSIKSKHRKCYLKKKIKPFTICNVHQQDSILRPFRRIYKTIGILSNNLHRSTVIFDGAIHEIQYVFFE